jgi:beta-lactamase superfamily II metal-dependent hydrolase
VNARAIAFATLAGVIASAAAWAVVSRPDGRLHVTVLSTGSSPAVLVRTEDGSTVLVDGGSSPTQLLSALGRVMPPTTSNLDMVVITGGEQAAVDGLNGLPGHYRVGIVVSPGGLTAGADTVVAALANAGATVLDAAGGAWSFGGATWRCLDFTALATARAMCALVIDDPTGRALVLGDAGTADQEDLCAVYGGRLAADLVVTPPGGAVSPVLLATARPSDLAVPLAQGAPGVAAPRGYRTDRTGVDGDLEYTGGASGLVESI